MLKGRNPTVLTVGFPKLAKHAAEVPDLNTPGAQREIDAGTDEQVDEDMGVQDIAERIDQLRLKEVQVCYSPRYTSATHRLLFVQKGRDEMLRTRFVHRDVGGQGVNNRSRAAC
jgi:hypothetical protein